MYRFPRGCYTDVRMEEVHSTRINMTMGQLDAFTVRSYRAAFVRLFDGRRWFYSAVSNPGAIQEEMDSLASMASPDAGIGSNPVVKRLQVNRERLITFEDSAVSCVEPDFKLRLLERSVKPLASHPLVKSWSGGYMDERKVKTFFSSLGADLVFDTQNAGLSGRFRLSEGDRRFAETAFVAASRIGELEPLEPVLESRLERSSVFLRESVPVEPGDYTVILSPFAAGIFAHESFGHKSEADFMAGDETMMREWAMGARVGSEMLSIADDGTLPGTGYTPFDDEGTSAERTWLVRNGVLSGRLHSASTAAALGEEVTGNARSIGFEYEPIPRMTTTFIEAGSSTREQLFREVEKGIFVESVLHGSGLSTFTMAPSLAWMIRGGEVAEPLRISVVTGSVMETLGRIDGLSDRVEITTVPGGGCGKHEQYPLPVGFGGPYVRVRGLCAR